MKPVYWMRYHGDTRPCQSAAWVFNDGSRDSFRYIHNGPALPDMFAPQWLRVPLRGMTLRETLDGARWSAMRYYPASD